MDAVGPDSVFPKDDLQEELEAALAEIEKVSEASPAAVATLDDGREEPDHSSLPGFSPPTQPESASSESAEAPDVPTAESEAADEVPPTPAEPVGEPAEAVEGWPADEDGAETPVASDETPSEPTGRTDAETGGLIEELFAGIDADDPAVVSDDKSSTPNEDALSVEEELAAAPAVVEQASKQDAGGEPKATPDVGSRPADEESTATLAEIEEPSAAPEPTPPQHSPDNADRPDGSATSEGSVGSDSPATADDELKGEAAPATPQPEQKKLRFQIGKKAARGPVAAHRPPDKRSEAVRALQPVTPLGKRLLRAVDEGLDAINRPVEQIGERTRTLLGYVALTTVIVSIVAMIVMPLILPHRDATMFLQEKRAALEAPPPVEEPDEAREGEEPPP